MGMPFRVDAFDGNCRAVASTLKLDGDLCLAVFSQVSDGVIGTDTPVGSAILALGRMVTSADAALSVFVSAVLRSVSPVARKRSHRLYAFRIQLDLVESLNRTQRMRLFRCVIHVIYGLQTAFGDWHPSIGYSMGFAVVLCRMLQEPALALHFAERYCHIARGVVLETRALMEFAAALRLADLGFSCHDLVALQHPHHRGTPATVYSSRCDAPS